MKRSCFLTTVLIAVTVLFFGASALNAGQPVVIVVPPLSVSGTPVPIMNHSFEDPSLAPNNFTAHSCNPADPICVQTANPVVGWNVMGTAGTWQPTGTSYPGGVPDGSNVAYANSGSNAEIFQVLEAVLESKRSYFLEVDIGRRADGPFVGYKVQLWAGETLLVEDDNTILPSPGAFVTSRIGVAIGADHPALGQNLEIVLISMGRQTNFDDVRLSFESFAPAAKVPFYVQLSGGETKLVAKNGSLELVARCVVNSATIMDLFLTSTQDGWFSTPEGPLLAGAERSVTLVEGTEPVYGNSINGLTAAAPDGSFIGIPRDSTGVGVNVFGHDCVAIGTATLISAP